MEENIYYKNDKGYLLHGDCCDMLKLLDAESVDLVVTSPPYDDMRSNYELLGFDKFKIVAEQLYRVIKQGGVVVWNVQDCTTNGSKSGTSFRQALYFKEIGFNIHDVMIWHKPNVFNFGSNLCYKQSFEYMFVFSKGRPNTVQLIKDIPSKSAGAVVNTISRSKDGKNNILGKHVQADFCVRDNVWDIQVGTNETGHPAIFPDKLANDHILTWTKENDVVLDPFMGSGTTAKMAVKNNRKWVGIELEEEFCKIIKTRMESIEAGVEYTPLKVDKDKKNLW